MDPGVRFSAEELARRHAANRPCLDVALRVLAGLGWIRASGDGWFEATTELRHHRIIPDRIVELYQWPLERFVADDAVEALLPWLQLSEQRWSTDHPYLADYLDGVLIVPLLLAMTVERRIEVVERTRGSHTSARLRLTVGRVLREQIERLFLSRGWGSRSSKTLLLKPAGRFLVDRVLITGAVASYRPMFARAHQLLFGDAASVFALDPAGHETHVDRTLNVVGSGYQHEKYFAALGDLIVPLFDDDAYALQPKYIVDVGCGDGSLLRRLYETVHQRTRRGRVLDRHPLVLVAVDYNEKALAAAARTLQGIEHVVVKGDIGDPLALMHSLRTLGIESLDDVLHVRSFMDHNRPYRPPEDRAGAQRRRFGGDGVYIGADGQAILPGELIQSTVEHLQRWSHLVTRHGLVMLEAHCLPLNVTAAHLDESESLHFDAYHALSRQYVLEAPTFLMCAAEAGLFCRPDHWRRFPRHLPFTRISLHHFERRPYTVRHLRPEDLPELRALPQVPLHVRAAGSRDATTQPLRETPREGRPEGPFVLLVEGRIAAAISSVPDGDVVRIVEARSWPAADRGYLQVLLRFVEQYWLLAGDVRRLEELDCATIAAAPVVAAPSLAHVVAQDVAARVAEYPFAPESDPRRAEGELGRFAFRWVLAIFQQMGVMRDTDETYDVDALKKRLGIAPKYHRYFHAVLAKLEAEGLLASSRGQIRATHRVRGYALSDIEAELSAFAESYRQCHPDCTGLLNVTASCLRRYREILTGRINAVDVLFGDAEDDAFADLFQGNAVSDYFNRIVAEAVRAAVRRSTASGPLDAAPAVRILEIGAGTGGTTAAILEAIGPVANGVEFCFSDISPAFVRRAKQRFAARYPWVEYRTFDVEADLSRQGLEAHGFDVVVAANVLHDTRSIAFTLGQTAGLLKPGGLLLLNEYTAVKDCLLFSGALLHGYWLFDDPQERLPDSALLSVPQWMAALERARLNVVRAFALPTQVPDAACGQSVLLCESSPSAATAAKQAHSAEQSASRAARNTVLRNRQDTSRIDRSHIVGKLVEQDVRMLLDERASAYASRRPLMEMGLDSIELVELRVLAERRVGVKLSPSFLFDHETPEKMTAALAKMISDEKLHELLEESSARRDSSTPAPVPEPAVISEDVAAAREPIAIVGTACRLPGGAASPDAFWRLLIRGEHGIVTMPSGRWRWPDFVDVAGNHRGIDKGGFLERIDEFDARFFRISPKEAELMDPQQRLLLELSWEAIEDAAHRPSELAGRQVGVFVGACHGDYRELLTTVPAATAAYVGTGSAYSILANRLSFFYDLKGPSVTIDTACSSSLFALHEAVAALRRRDCEQALVGAVNLLCTPTNSIAYYQAGMLSPSGICRTFDEAADGYVRGEGGAMLLLKPLATALADGDAIYGVVTGTAVNHGGQAASLTAPKPESQAAVIEAAWLAAGAAPDSIAYIETHGTGTKLGDPVEISGLVEAFRRLYDASGRTWPPAKPHCALGAVKTNVGHLEAAAGLVGVLKAVLAAQRGRIPRTLNVTRVNPDIDLTDGPFYISATDEVWCSSRDERGRERPRRAGVSSFGFGGANAHVVVEEHRPPTTEADAESRAHVIPLSAKDGDGLIECAKRLLDFLQSNVDSAPTTSTAPDLGDRLAAATLEQVAYTLQVGREPMDERLAFVVDGKDELVATLRRYLAGGTAIPGCYRGSSRPRGADTQAAASLEASIAASDLTQLASLWTRGVDVDWAALWRGARPGRVHLPTYPFSRKRYWLPQTGSALANPASHPLLGRDDVEVLGVRCGTVLTGDEFFLADHVIHGRKVLPAVVYLEMARAAVQRAMATPHEAAARTRGVRMRDVVWLKPFCAGRAPASLDVRLTREGRDEVSFEICGGPQPSGADVVTHSKGRIGPCSTVTLPRSDLTAARTRCSRFRFGPDDCYRTFAAHGYEYGPAQRAIADIYVGSDELVARLTLPGALAETRDEFVVHPTMADAALQATLIGFALADRGGRDVSFAPVMPFALDSVEIWRPCTADMWASARRHDGVFDIDLCDRDGAVCVRFTGWTMRPVEPAVEAPGEDAAVARELILTPTWERLSVAPRGASPRSSVRVAIAGGTVDQHAAIQSFEPHARPLAVHPGDSIDAIARKVASWGDIEHLVCIVPHATLNTCDDDSLIAAQQEGVLFLFRLIKGMLAAGYRDRSLRWSVLTTDVHAVRMNQPATPTHAGVHGLIGSLAREYPGWTVRLLDLPAAGEWPWADLLSIPGDPHANPIVHREGCWYQQQLVPYRPAAEPVVLARPGDVYVVIGGAGGIGSAWSEALVRRSGVQLVWIGRRAEDDALRARLQRLAQFGPAPLYIRADATDRDQLEAAREKIVAEFGRVDALIHAAAVLDDQSLEKMTEAQFRAALGPKVDTCVRLAQVFGRTPPRWVLFFSSVNVFTRFAGQSNYVAGCTFADAFARRLAAEWPCTVRVVNWGYWGEVGVVASERYRSLMARRGFGSIDLSGAVRLLDDLLAERASQLIYLKASGPAALEGACVRSDEWTIHLEEVLPSCVAAIAEATPGRDRVAWAPPAGWVRVNGEIEESLQQLLSAQLQSMRFGSAESEPLEAMQARSGITDRYRRWCEHSVRVLEASGHLVRRGDRRRAGMSMDSDVQAAWEQWERKKPEWLQEPDWRAQLQFAERSLRALPDILTGRRAATDVLFANDADELMPSFSGVADVLRSGAVARFCHRMLATAVVRYVAERRRRDPGCRIRIIEIGAGTGAASEAIFEALRPWVAHIEEYTYTDVSSAFLAFAKRSLPFRPDYLRYQTFDVERSLDSQAIARASYDLAIASNVLHATRDVHRTLRNTKALLRTNGLLLLNEITAATAFNHVTFGLLDGWWLFADPELRVAGSPALDPRRWRAVLEEEAFRSVLFAAPEAHQYGQQVIVAESDGFVRQIAEPIATVRTNGAGALEVPQTGAASDGNRRHDPLSIAEIMRRPREIATEHLLDNLRLRAAETLGTEPEILDAPSRPFADTLLAEFGMDSLSSNSLRDVLRRELGVDIPAQRIIGERAGSIVETMYGQLLLRHVSTQAPAQDQEPRETYVF